MFFGLIKSEDDKRIVKSIESYSSIIIEELSNKGLISLYLAGTILNKLERNKFSDIDFFGIVSDEFDFNLENSLNTKLEDIKNASGNGFECRFRAFTIGSLKGLNMKGKVIHFMQPARLVQRFPYFKHIWGEKHNFSKDFMPPMQLRDEAKHLIKIAEGMIKDVREHQEKFPLKDYHKIVFEITRVELQFVNNAKYIIHRHEIIKALKNYRNHVVHKAWTLRDTEPSREEILQFSLDLEIYIAEMKKLFEL